MAKKKHVTPIIMDDPQKVAFHTQALKMELAATDIPLATEEEVNLAIATVTNKPLPKPSVKPKKAEKAVVDKTIAEKTSLPAPTLAQKADTPRNV